MKANIVKSDGVMVVDGVMRQIDLSDLPNCHAVHWDSVRGTGKIEFTFDDTIEVQQRDVRAEEEACAAARAAGLPEPTEPIFTTVQVRRPDLVIDRFDAFQKYLDRWDAAAPPPPPPPDPRLVELDSEIKDSTYGGAQPATLAELKAMTRAQFSAWFDANFTTNTALIALVKRLTLIIIRRVL